MVFRGWASGLGSRVQNSGFRVWGLGFRVLEFRKFGFEFRVLGLGRTASSPWLREMIVLYGAQHRVKF